MIKYREEDIEKNLDIRLVVFVMNGKANINTTKIEENKENNAKEMEQIKEWCLDNQFEFIPIPSSSLPTFPSSHVVTNKMKDCYREKEGYERVVEALQAHTWKSLTLKDQRMMKEYDKKENIQEKTNTSSNLTSIDKDQDKKEEKSIHKVISTFSPDHSKSMNDDKSISIKSDLLANAINIHNEEDIDELDSIFNRVKEISISSREGRFRSDEERRREAASTALKLAAVFGLNMDDLDGGDLDSSDEEIFKKSIRKGKNGVQAE